MGQGSQDLEVGPVAKELGHAPAAEVVVVDDHHSLWLGHFSIVAGGGARFEGTKRTVEWCMVLASGLLEKGVDHASRHQER